MDGGVPVGVEQRAPREPPELDGPRRLLAGGGREGGHGEFLAVRETMVSFKVLEIWIGGRGLRLE